MHGSRDYEFDPHLSLIYKDLPESTRATLAAATTVPSMRVTFDRLRVIRCPDRITTRADVEAWQTLGERFLRDSARANP